MSDSQEVGRIVHQCTRAYMLLEANERDTVEIKSVDVHFFLARVNMASAHAHRERLVELLNGYPWGVTGVTRLTEGPGYREVGSVLHDQGTALRLFALGAVLGFWNVVTPRLLGYTEEQAADEVAGRGLVLITGYHP